MTLRIQVFAIIFGFGIAAVLFEMMRKRQILEKYSLIWFFSVILIIVLALWRNLLDKFASLLGILYAPSALFVFAAFCGIMMFLHITVVISKLTEQNKALAQEVGLLKYKLRKLIERHNPQSDNSKQYKEQSGSLLNEPSC